MRSDESDRKLLREQVERFAASFIGPRVQELESGSLEQLEGLLERLAELGLLEPSEEELVADAVGALSSELASAGVLVLAHHVAQSLAASTDGVLLGTALYAEPDDVPELVLSHGDPPRVTGHAELVVGPPVVEELVLLTRSASGEVALVRVAVRDGRLGGSLHTLGMRGCPTADVVFDGAECRVLARGGAALGRLLEVRRAHTAAVAAICAGIARSSTDAALAYARERRQGGCAIIEHHAVRELLAEMMADTVTAELAVGALLDDRKLAGPLLLARVKQCVARATRSGVQVLGGYGYLEDYAQERRMRDARQAGVLFGRATTDMLRAFETPS